MIALKLHSRQNYCTDLYEPNITKTQIYPFLQWCRQKNILLCVTVHYHHICKHTYFCKIVLFDHNFFMLGRAKKTSKELRKPRSWANWFFNRFFSKKIIIPGAPKKSYLHICLHICLHSQPIVHATCFSSQIHPRASIGTIEIKFEAVSPCILTTRLKSFFLKQDFFITLNFAWEY